MTSTDLVHSGRHVAYEAASRAEEALTTTLSLHATETGPVNLTWNRPPTDL